MRARLAVVVLASLIVGGCAESPVASPVAAPVLAPIITVPAAPSEALVRAATLVAEQPGYKFSFELALTGLPETNGTPLSVSGAGSVDHASQRTEVRLNLEGLLDAARLAGESTAEFDAMLGDGQIELIQDGTTVYVRMPYLAQQAGVATPWVSLVLPEPVPGHESNRPAPGLFGSMGSAGAPDAYLAQLKALDSTVVEDGSAVVRGIPTTHYRGTLDLGKLLAQGGPSAEATQFSAMMPFFQALKLPYEVWVDRDGLPRKLATTVDFRAFAPAGLPASEPVPVLTFLYELYDFGDPGAIKPPDTSEVTPLDLASITALR